MSTEFQIGRGIKENLPVEDNIIIGKIYITRDTKQIFIGDEVEGIKVLLPLGGRLGRIDETNSEIFNDYENNKANGEYNFVEGYSNQAGGKAYVIEFASAKNKTYTLESVEGLNKGMQFSLVVGGSYGSIGSIINIDINNKTVTVDNFKDIDDTTSTSSRTCYFVIIENPLLGNVFVDSDGAHVEGVENIAVFSGAHAEGYQTIAGGRYAHTEGQATYAFYAAHAEGWNTKALDKYTHAEGENTIAKALAAHAEGSGTLAAGLFSHSEGFNTQALGEGSHAGGHTSRAIGAYSFAHGSRNPSVATQAVGKGSIALGDSVIAWGDGCVAIGRNVETGKKWITGSTYEYSIGQIALGQYNDPLVDGILTVGNGTAAKKQNALVLYADGHMELPQITTNIGTSESSVVTKGYLDSQLGDVNAAITELQTYVDSLVNGGNA